MSELNGLFFCFWHHRQSSPDGHYEPLHFVARLSKLKRTRERVRDNFHVHAVT